MDFHAEMFHIIHLRTTAALADTWCLCRMLPYIILMFVKAALRLVFATMSLKRDRKILPLSEELFWYCKRYRDIFPGRFFAPSSRKRPVYPTHSLLKNLRNTIELFPAARSLLLGLSRFPDISVGEGPHVADSSAI